MSEQGSRRYPRTFGGLIGSMIVLVVIVVPLVLLTHLWGNANRSHDGLAPVTPPVDYVSVVREVQQSGQSLVYPARIPSGWTVTSADWDIITDRGRPQWRLGALAPDHQFAGFYEQDAPTETLVGETLGANATHGPDATVATPVGTHWSTWTSPSGDVAYATPVGKRTLVVYGTSQSDVRTLMGQLTSATLPHASRQA